MCLYAAHVFFTFAVNLNIMAAYPINKYVWLVETIYNAKKISFADINKKWLNSNLSESVEISRRTFHKWRIAIEEIFGLVINCERKGGYKYYIENVDEIKDGSIYNWLLKTISVSNLLMGYQHLKERILLEDVPSGQKYLSKIIDAMNLGQCVSITYKDYQWSASETFDIEPYCVKLFKQRWYVVGVISAENDIKVYSLDRILCLEILTDKKFKMPSSFESSKYFEEYYGIVVDEDYDVEEIKFKISAKQAKYLRSLPLHCSQQEIETTDEYCIFVVHLRPTYDFIQEIMRQKEEIELLSPQWLRDEIAWIARSMWKKHQ